jgi:glyoxylase-like metal-dependent hydrolase (beta-lactamase superfamily II)
MSTPLPPAPHHSSRVLLVCVVTGLAVLAVVVSACTATTPGPVSSGSPNTPTDGSPTASADGTHEHSFGDVVQIAPDTLLVVGRHLDVTKGQADVANSLLYRHDGVVYWVDSGATQDFVAPLRRAFRQLQPYTKVVLVNTHGHADHVGNNALLDHLGAASVEHYVSQAEIATMRDQVGYFAEGFSVISPFQPDFADSRSASAKLLRIFEPIDVESGHVQPLESLPLAEIRVGRTFWTGYVLGDGAVQLVRAQGHTAGEVMVYLPKIKLLHLADEDTGYQHVFPGHNSVLSQAVFARIINAIDDGAVDAAIDGHSFDVKTGAQMKAYLANRLESAVAYDVAFHRILREHPQGLTVAEMVSAVKQAPEMTNATGSDNASPLFDLLQVTVKLRELGLLPDNATATTRIVLP